MALLIDCGAHFAASCAECVVGSDFAGCSGQCSWHSSGCIPLTNIGAAIGLDGASPASTGAPIAAAECTVLGGPFALFMQGCLFGVTVLVLVYKKNKEDREAEASGGKKRSWYQFGLDGSKQFLGAGWIHVANMLCAILFAGKLPGVDGCTWYAANIIIDDTLGVFVEYLLLMGQKWLVAKTRSKRLVELLESGSYYDENKNFLVFNFAAQLAVWFMIVTTMKVSMVALMTSCPFLVELDNYLLLPVADKPKVKLFVVMIIIPGVMNALQFWLTDNFIKHQEDEAATVDNQYKDPQASHPSDAAI